MITRRLVWALGLSQLLCWGVSYYLAALFAFPVAAETGWTPALVYGGFSAAIVVMGLVSGLVGRAIDRWGGRPVMTAGSCLMALAILGLALSHGLLAYYAAWLCLGLAMRMSLYDAAFAALARIGGGEARRPISQITLLGGLASSALWPVGQALIDAVGWRGALVAYAGLALLTAPLHLLIPSDRHDPERAGGPSVVAPLARTRGDQLVSGTLFAAGLMLTTFLASAMSAHQIGILTGLGLATGVAVWVSTLRGVGQSAARLCEILFGRRLDPLALGVLATALTPIGFLFAYWGGVSAAAALAFSVLFGAGNGLTTIVRGTQPLVLFDPAIYGSLVGRLVGPSFFVSAAAPVTVALVIDRWGEVAAIHLSMAVGLGALLCAVALRRRFRLREDPAGPAASPRA